jgi:hypothetical protein
VRICAHLGDCLRSHFGAMSANHAAAAPVVALAAANIPIDPPFYVDDLVCRKSNPTKLGVIQRSSWDEEEEQEESSDDEPSQESAQHHDDNDEDHPVPAKSNRRRVNFTHHENDDDDGDEENEEDNASDVSAQPPIPAGSVVVAWSNNPHDDETILAEELQLVDRSFLPGDICVRNLDSFAASTGESSNILLQAQIGTVLSTTILADLMDLNGEVRHKQVDTRELELLHYFNPGQHVVQGCKLGIVQDCLLDVTVEFSDGAQCIVRDAFPDALKQENVTTNEDEESYSSSYYPGQPVSARPAVWRQAEWLDGATAAISTKNCGYNLDEVLETVQEITEFPSEISAILGKFVGFVSSQANRGVVIRVRPTTVSVEWISGTENVDLDEADEIAATELTPLTHAANALFMAGDNCTYNREIDSTDWRPFIYTVIRTKTLVDVQFQDSSVVRDIPAATLSARTNLLDNEVCVNDFVSVVGCVKLAFVRKVDVVQRLCTVQFSGLDYIPDSNSAIALQSTTQAQFSHNLAQQPLPGEIVTVSLFEIHPVAQYEFSLSGIVLRVPGVTDSLETNPESNKKLGFAGQITAIEGGKLTVLFADGSELRLDPDQLINMEMENDPTEHFADYVEEFLNPEDAEAEEHSDDDETQWLPDLKERNAPSRATIEVVESDEVRTEENKERTDLEEHENARNNEAEPAEDEKSLASALAALTIDSSTKCAASFQSFSVIEHISGHKFQSQTTAFSNQRQIRRIQKEWKSLESHLPSGAHILVYSDRMDCMKILLSGPLHTPYYNSLFIFDLYFSADFPNSPPMCYFNSRGARVSPNLYADGKVCLSLLGTWVSII